MTERGVSDVLGYALVFALVTSLVAVTYVGGIGALNDASDETRIANAERAFDVLDANLAAIATGTAPTRTAHIRLRDARIGLGDPVRFSLLIDGTTVYSRSIDPVYYATARGDTRIVASNGAIFRQQPSGVALLTPPSFVVGDRTVVPIVDTAGTSADVAGDGRFAIRTTAIDRRVARFATTGDTVAIRIESPRAAAWARYISGRTGEGCTVSAGVATCPIPASRVSIQTVIVDVSVE